MTLGGIKEGDIVQCDIRGDRFLAFVVDHVTYPARGLGIDPIGNGRSYRSATARQVIGHWRKKTH